MEGKKIRIFLVVFILITIHFLNLPIKCQETKGEPIQIFKVKAKNIQDELIDIVNSIEAILKNTEFRRNCERFIGDVRKAEEQLKFTLKKFEAYSKELDPLLDRFKTLRELEERIKKKKDEIENLNREFESRKMAKEKLVKDIEEEGIILIGLKQQQKEIIRNWLGKHLKIITKEPITIKTPGRDIKIFYAYLNPEMLFGTFVMDSPSEIKLGQKQTKETKVLFKPVAFPEVLPRMGTLKIIPREYTHSRFAEDIDFAPQNFAMGEGQVVDFKNDLKWTWTASAKKGFTSHEFGIIFDASYKESDEKEPRILLEVARFPIDIKYRPKNWIKDNAGWWVPLLIGILGWIRFPWNIYRYFKRRKAKKTSSEQKILNSTGKPLKKKID